MTMGNTSRLAGALTRHLTKECALYEKYLIALEKQREALTKFETDKIDALNHKRAKLIQEMKEYEKKRLELVSELPKSKERRLVDLIREHFSGKEGIELQKLAHSLRELVQTSRAMSQEFGLANQFALNMVNGSISLIWQATQNVSRQYGRKGALSESYNPTRSRQETVLRQA